jgi:hypothetical protein
MRSILLNPHMSCCRSHTGDYGRARHDSRLPPPVSGIRYSFRCEAVTDWQIGAVVLDTFIEIALGIASADFKRMAASYSGRWDLVQLRCANFTSCTLEERVALILLEPSGNFRIRDGQGVRLIVPARHKDIAELVAPVPSQNLIHAKSNILSRARPRPW